MLVSVLLMPRINRFEGDLQQLPADFAVTELWQVLRGQADAARRDAEPALASAA